MDVVQTLTWFDRFHAKHKETCGIGDLDVSAERPTDSETKFTLKCPTCGNTISGSVRDVDMPNVIQLLKPGKAN